VSRMTGVQSPMTGTVSRMTDFREPTLTLYSGGEVYVFTKT
jgi:hypothetical protein